MQMTEPAYVAVAGDYARRIRSGALPGGTQLPSYAEIAEQNGVSDIVVRKAIELLQRQGLVRAVRRRGIFVSDRPNLRRVSPERQTEDPETTFSHETDQRVFVERETETIPAPGNIASAFGLTTGDDVTLTITRATEGGRPVSISDTYQPLGLVGTHGATVLEETVSDQIPNPRHAEWLQVTPGDLVKTVHQQFFTPSKTTIMVSDVSYPIDRYDAFVFRMTLPAKV